MEKKIKVLFVGEEIFLFNAMQKAYNSFNMGSAIENSKYFLEAMEKNGIEYDHIPTHAVSEEFPWSLEEMKQYDAIIFSDVSSDSVLVSLRTMAGQRTPNRLELIEHYVSEGGSFMMCGGYVSFTGLNGKGFYKRTPIERILPVNLMEYDDRVEAPEGFLPNIIEPNHPIMQGMPEKWEGWFLSYNRLLPKNNATVVAMIPKYNDPFLVAGEYGKGRVLASAVDCAPHGACPEFLSWEYKDTLYGNMVKWLAKEI